VKHCVSGLLFNILGGQLIEMKLALCELPKIFISSLAPYAYSFPKPIRSAALPGSLKKESVEGSTKN
jgi:hypothetical protein